MRVGYLIAVGALLSIPIVFQLARSDTPVYGFDVVATHPHDTRAYCQGLLFDGGRLYESTGEYGRSTVRQTTLDTGEVVASTRLRDDQFGEGLVAWGDRLIQLTWKEHLAIVYDKATLKRVGEFRYPGEGWGITTDGKRLIMSDGSAVLRFLDPETFTETSRVEVRSGDSAVRNINELEYVNGEVYANIWRTNVIARIDPTSGRVCGWINLAGLNKTPPSDEDSVLNGIAYDADRRRLFVTGKLWGTLYEIKVVR